MFNGVARPGLPTRGSICDPSASAEVGRLGAPIPIAKGTNSTGQVMGRNYIGHAFDQMQGRGITPRILD